MSIGAYELLLLLAIWIVGAVNVRRFSDRVWQYGVGVLLCSFVMNTAIPTNIPALLATTVLWMFCTAYAIRTLAPVVREN